MDSIARQYFDDLLTMHQRVKVTDGAGKEIAFYLAVKKACGLIQAQARAGRKLMFIGNGGSAAISSHMAVDFFKRGRVPAMAFNDSALLTCMGNDYGYDHVFEKPIEMYAEEGDILIAISSSGRSANILRGVKAAVGKKGRVITLSGFAEGNPLMSSGEINFYVPSTAYGIVEVFHHSICHCILDTIIGDRERSASAPRA